MTRFRFEVISFLLWWVPSIELRVRLLDKWTASPHTYFALGGVLALILFGVDDVMRKKWLK